MFWCLFAQRDLLHLHDRLSRFAKNKSKSGLLKNLLKLESLVYLDGIYFQITSGIGNLKDDVGRDLSIIGSRKTRAILSQL